MEKCQANAKQYPEADSCYLQIIHMFHPRYHPKIIEYILKISKRTSVSVFMRLYN